MCMYVYVCVCRCVYMYIYICMYMYIYMYMAVTGRRNEDSKQAMPSGRLNRHLDLSLSTQQLRAQVSPNYNDGPLMQDQRA